MAQSLYRQASLVMNPYGAKDTLLPSIKPTDGSGDFTFSRDGAGASPATRVNASGLIEKGRTNEILQSNQFDTTWTNVNTSETSGQSGYDGTNDAWLLTRSGGLARIVQAITINSVATFSVYAKAGTQGWVWIRDAGGVGSYFDLSTGAVGTASATIDANIESVGSGWYRCSITAAFNTNEFRIYVADADNDASGTSGNIYIQDAQLEQGLIATDVIETTTAPVSAGLLGDMPRLDYSGGATCPSLLLEPSRVNVISQSEYFSSSANVSVSYNNAISPEGVQNATHITGDAGTLTKFIDANGASTGAYTISVFAKYDSHQWIQLAMGGIATYANFDIKNGVVGSTNGTSDIEDYGNGWYRCSVQATSGTPLSHFVLMVDSGTAARLASSSSTNSFWVYGLQSEIGSYPTSYIPTYGSASTRGADSCSKTSASAIIGQTEGTLFAEFEINADNTNGFNRVLAVGDGTSNNRIFIFANNTEVFRFYVANGGAAQVDIVSTTSILGGRHKVAFAYKANDFIAYVDGVQVGTDTSGTIPSCSNVYVGTHESGSTQPLEGELSQALLFKTRLTNAELAALTTI